ncbi:WecB/TagA/CpsF family glycosyltransferase [Thermogemmatispora sp.]|uniref:WecB/TagA/CpsF family glycosyltransferase n=1 Tax=Thermogemmatispora sp. TaxID=1968838 RepID=UPI0035E43279
MMSSVEQVESTPGQSWGNARSVSVLGVRIDRVTQEEALTFIEERIRRRRASGNRLPCCQVATVNPEFVMEARRNPAFRRVLDETALNVPDGIGVVWASRYLGQPAPERITGTDLIPALAERCAIHGYRLYLLGAAPGVAEAAAARLCSRFPGLQIAGTYAGSPDPAEEETILERLAAAQADLLCVAYGAPAQELWIWRNLARLPVAVAIGVGGALDFLSGHKKRAPHAWQRLGLEWLYRLYREPWRWRRMLALPRFALLVIFKGRGRHSQA